MGGGNSFQCQVVRDDSGNGAVYFALIGEMKPGLDVTKLLEDIKKRIEDGRSRLVFDLRRLSAMADKGAGVLISMATILAVIRGIVILRGEPMRFDSLKRMTANNQGGMFSLAESDDEVEQIIAENMAATSKAGTVSLSVDE